MKCPHCQAIISKDSFFCNKCGGGVAATEDRPSSPGGAGLKAKAPRDKDDLLPDNAGVKSVSIVPETPRKDIVETVIFDGVEETGNAPVPDLSDIRAALKDKYDIIQFLGSDALGANYEARERSLTARRVALKVFPADFAGNAEKKALFEREIRALAGMSHPNIMSIYSAGIAEGYIYYATRLVQGKSLGRVLESENKMSTADVVRVAERLCDVLGYVHRRNMFYGDLNTDTILVDGQGNIHVTNFGIAALKKAVGAGSVSGSGVPMAPERVTGAPADERSDLYSLGVLLYEMLTGKKPFGERREPDGEKPEPVEKFRKSLPEGLGALVNRLLERNPLKRGTVGEAASVLRSLSEKELESLKRVEESIYGANESFEGQVYRTGEIIPAALWFIAVSVLTPGFAFLFRLLGLSWFSGTVTEGPYDMWDTGIFVGSLLAAVSGCALMIIRRGRLTSAAMSVYWLGTAVSLILLSHRFPGAFGSAATGLTYGGLLLLITSGAAAAVSVFFVFRLRKTIDAMSLTVLSALACYGMYLVLDVIRSFMAELRYSTEAQNNMSIAGAATGGVFVLIILSVAALLFRRKIDFLFYAWMGSGSRKKYATSVLMLFVMAVGMVFYDGMRAVSKSIPTRAILIGTPPGELDLPLNPLRHINTTQTIVRGRKFDVFAIARAGFEIDISEATGSIHRMCRMDVFDLQGNRRNAHSLDPSTVPVEIEATYRRTDFVDYFNDNRFRWITGYWGRDYYTTIKNGKLITSYSKPFWYSWSYMDHIQYRNFSAIFQMKTRKAFSENCEAGFVFRMVDRSNYYSLSMNTKSKQLILTEMINRDRITLYSGIADNLHVNDINTVKVYAVDSVIKVYANNRLLASVSNGKNTNYGRMGFSIQEGIGEFDNLRVYSKQ